jgi:hypothetical protein
MLGIETLDNKSGGNAGFKAVTHIPARKAENRAVASAARAC